MTGLLTRLAQQIHDRTVDARDLIRQMNTEMHARPRMSSGTTVGVSWQLADNLEEEQRAVCGLLDADAARLGPEDLSRMRALIRAPGPTSTIRPIASCSPNSSIPSRTRGPAPRTPARAVTPPLFRAA